MIKKGKSQIKQIIIINILRVNKNKDPKIEVEISSSYDCNSIIY